MSFQCADDLSPVNMYASSLNAPILPHHLTPPFTVVRSKGEYCEIFKHILYSCTLELKPYILFPHHLTIYPSLREL